MPKRYSSGNIAFDFKNASNEEFYNELRQRITNFAPMLRNDNVYGVSREDMSFNIEIDYNYDPKDFNLRILESFDIDGYIKAFNAMKRSNNFDKAIGYRIEAEVSDTNMLTQWPTIFIEYDEEYLKELLEKRANQAQEISKFYNSLNYKGD